MFIGLIGPSVKAVRHYVKPIFFNTKEALAKEGPETFEHFLKKGKPEDILRIGRPLQIGRTPRHEQDKSWGDSARPDPWFIAKAEEKAEEPNDEAMGREEATLRNVQEDIDADKRGHEVPLFEDEPVE